MRHGFLRLTAAVALGTALCARAFGAAGGEAAVAPYNVKPLPPDAQGVFVEEGDFAHDGTTQVRIENSLLRLIVAPDLGGRIGSLVLKKSGNDLTCRPTAARLVSPASGVQGGLAGATATAGNASVCGAKCAYTIEKAEGRAAITLTAAVKFGPVAGLTVRKRITVEADSARIGVDYELLNDAKSAAPATVTLDLDNMAGGPVADTVLFFPMDAGILRFVPAKADARDATMGEPARGWAAALDAKAGDGLAMRLDYPYVDFVRTAFFRMPRPSLNWRLLPQTIEPGRSLWLHESLLPFAGLAGVQGVSGGAVGSMAAPDKIEADAPARIEVRVCSARAGKIEVAFSARRLPDGRPQGGQTKSVDVSPVDAAKLIFTWTPPRDGTYVLSAAVAAPGEEACVLEAPAYVGEPSAPYAMAREGRRVSAEPIFDPKSVDLSYISPEVVTPHIAWARPYARGRTRAAFLLEGTTSCREVVELGERFEIEPSSSLGSFVSPQYDSGAYYRKLDVSLVRAKYNELLAPGRQYDAIVLSGDTWDQLTGFSKARIREMVWNGAGLVWIDPTTEAPDALEMLPASDRSATAKPGAWESKGDHFITRAIPFAAVPPARSYAYGDVKGAVVATAGKMPLVVLGEYGRGRVALLNYVASDRLGLAGETHALLPREIASPKIQQPYWEYQYGLIGRALIWAAQKEPAEEIVAVDTADKPALHVRVVAQRKTDATLTCRSVDQYGQTLATGSGQVALRKGTNDLTVTLKALPRGMNVVHLILETPAGLSDWRAVALPTETPANIVGVKLSKDSYDRSEIVHADVTVGGPVEAGFVTVVAQLEDDHGRILARADQAVRIGNKAGITAPFEFPLAGMISARGALELTLMSGDKLDERRVEKFIVRPPRTWDDFECLMWTAGPVSHESLFDARLKIMQELGVTGIVEDAGNGVAPWAAAFLARDLRLVARGGAKQAAAAGAKYGALLDMIGGERAAVEPGGPAAVAKMRSWLKTKYADLAALNAEWATDFKSWDDVQPMLKLDDALARNAATKTMNFAPWADWRAYLEDAFAGELRADAAVLAAGDPLGRPALSCTQAPAADAACNWYELAHTFKAIQDCGPERALRSFAGTGDLRLAPWINCGKQGPVLQRAIWEILFAGCDGVSPWCEQTNIEPDYTLFAGARDLQAAVTQIHGGPGKLLMNCPLTFDPIAVHDSQDSLRGAFALGRAGELDASRDGMIAVLVALGYQPSCLSSAQIERGELTPEKTKIFFMAHSVTLSAKEAEQIRSYVKGGGVVVADVLPAVMNEHCRALPKGQLDDVFGVTRTEIKVSDAPAVLKFSDEVHGPITGDAFEPSLKATFLKAPYVGPTLGEAPAILDNTFGKGHAIYINADVFSPYAALSDNRKVADAGARAQGLEVLMGEFLNEAGCKPRLQIVNAGGLTRSRSTAIYAHDSGLCLFLGTASGASEAKQTATVKFDREAYVYDLVTGESFGRTSAVRTQLGPHAAHLFALLPYEVTGIMVKADKPGERGAPFRASVTIQAEGKPGLHVVRMEVFDPTGHEVTLYAANLLCKEGAGEAVIPFALNDPAGKWTLHFHDVATGVRAEHIVELP